MFDVVETGVDPGTIDPVRAAVLRGRVINRDGTPLTGVRVSIKDHPEFGQTLSRADGLFDLAVNGGGLLVIDYERDGLLPAQRQIDVPWQDYVNVPDVALVPLDDQATVIDLTSPDPMQVAQGSPVTDADGTRQAGHGEMVYWEASREAALTLEPSFVPVDHAVVGIVDDVGELHRWAEHAPILARRVRAPCLGVSDSTT